MLAFLGKVLFLSSIVFSAYTLFSHNETINKFNSNLPGALKQCQCLPPATIKLITDNILYVRYAVVGLLGLAGLLVVSSSRFLTFLVLVGLSLATFVLANPHYDNSEATKQAFLHNVGLAGALIYLIGVAGKVKRVAPIEKKNQ